MLNRTPVEDCLELKEYLDEMIDHWLEEYEWEGSLDE